MSATDCECCPDVARFSGTDETGRLRQFCNFHTARAKADRVLYRTQPINGTVKDKKPVPTKAPSPMGML